MTATLLRRALLQSLLAIACTPFGRWLTKLPSPTPPKTRVLVRALGMRPAVAELSNEVDLHNAIEVIARDVGAAMVREMERCILLGEPGPEPQGIVNS